MLILRLTLIVLRDCTLPTDSTHCFSVKTLIGNMPTLLILDIIHFHFNCSFHPPGPMEEKITIYFADTFRSKDVEEEVRRALAATGIEFSSEQGPPGRIAAVLWEERYSSGQEGRANIHQQIRELSLSDYKVIVINLDRNLSDPEKWQLLMAGAADIIDWQKKELFPILMKARTKRWRIIDQLMNLDEVKKKMIGDCLEWKRFGEGVDDKSDPCDRIVPVPVRC